MTWHLYTAGLQWWTDSHSGNMTYDESTGTWFLIHIENLAPGPSNAFVVGWRRQNDSSERRHRATCIPRKASLAEHIEPAVVGDT